MGRRPKLLAVSPACAPRENPILDLNQAEVAVLKDSFASNAAEAVKTAEPEKILAVPALQLRGASGRRRSAC